MEKRITLLVFLLFSTLSPICSCNSSDDDLEEESSEVPKSETRKEIKEDIEQPNTEIKQEINKDISRINSNQYNKTYTIQIGAFSSESNAQDFSVKASSMVGREVNYSQIDGLYKVRLGTFASVDDALVYVSKLREEGFPDCFLIRSK